MVESRTRAFAAAAGIGVLAVSQPLYSFLLASPEFFAARSLGRPDIAALGVLLFLLPALAFGALGAIFMRRGPGTVLGEYLRILALLSLACPIVFLIRAPWPAPSSPALAAAGDAPPVVVLILDELPLATLLDASGAIDAAWYPSFARLARQAAWYREARAVSDDTFKAVPALLTGELPRPPKSPWHRDYPRNLFTLLADTHRMDVTETQTSLCPPALCRAPRPPAAARLRSALSDLAVIYAHRVTPRAWAGGLPSVSHTWKDFVGARGEFSWARFNASAGTAYLDRAGAMDRFVAGAGRDGLHFLHVLLPHPPWVFFPSGKAGFAANEPVVIGDGGREDRWLADEDVVLAAWQRHILQTRYVDAVIGRMLDALEASDAWRDALLVVAADHGASFRPGGRRRARTAENASEVLPVPLFIKYPGTGPVGPQTREASTVDLLPTVLAALGKPLPPGLDGVDLRATQGPRRELKFILKDGSRVPALEGWAAARREADRRRALLGDGVKPGRLFALGPARGLLGRTPVEAPPSSCRFALEQNVQGALDFSRAYLSGRLSCPAPAPERMAVAAAAGGRVVATGVSERFADGSAALRLVLPEGAAADGLPRLYEVRNLGAETLTAPLAVVSEAWKLEAGSLRGTDGRMAALEAPLGGRLSAVVDAKDVLVVEGDARREGGEIADEVLVFAGAAFLYGGRPDAKTGRFDFALPKDFLPPGSERTLRVFALDGAGAWELAR
ncbi:MAG: sulfatase-like hydrolase/transferase [Elusimicrobia bacterium]|nr:sulfatase-like hydrolase/transferase [Elusimicrobiota bacterium]